MVVENILQSEILTNFVYPLLLVFFILFAILEKTKLLGDGQKQINAIVSLVIALIFVGFAWPKMVIGNLMLFLTVALIVIFIVLLVWGFATGGTEMPKIGPAMNIILGILAIIAVIIAVFWATGSLGSTFDFLFDRTWSSALWTNVLFIVIIAAALAVVLKK